MLFDILEENHYLQMASQGGSRDGHLSDVRGCSVPSRGYWYTRDYWQSKRRVVLNAERVVIFTPSRGVIQLHDVDVVGARFAREKRIFSLVPVDLPAFRLWYATLDRIRKTRGHE